MLTLLTFACRVVMAIAFSAMSIGRMNSLAPDYGRARDSANRVFALWDDTPAIDPYSKQGYRTVIIAFYKRSDFSTAFPNIVPKVY